MKGALLKCSVISGFVELKQVEGSRDVTDVYKQAAQREITGLFAYEIKDQREIQRVCFSLRYLLSLVL